MGRELETSCATDVRRYVTAERLTRAHAGGGESVERVVIVSRQPHLTIEATVLPVIA